MGAESARADGELLRSVAAGDAAAGQALAALYDRHSGWLYARLSRRCPDPETVHEVLQDTFVTVWRSASAHRGAEAGGWLWTIAARRLIDAQRAAARVPSARNEAHAHAPSAEEQVLAAGLTYSEVGSALDRLSPELRAVLQATVIDGLTTREAAAHLGIPEGTVKTRAMRARRELRALLGSGPEALGGTA